MHFLEEHLVKNCLDQCTIKEDRLHENIMVLGWTNFLRHSVCCQTERREGLTSRKAVYICLSASKEHSQKRGRSMMMKDVLLGEDARLRQQFAWTRAAKRMQTNEGGVKWTATSIIED